MSTPNLNIATAPFVHKGLSTNRIMFEVVLALLPVFGAAVYYFGISAIVVVLGATAGAVISEWFFDAKRKSGSPGSLLDGSAILTGVLLGLSLPPATPLWIALLGGSVGIILGKVVWGGLGQNLFNPALVGRAFLQASFPVVTTTWTAPRQGFFHFEPSTFAAPLMRAPVDVISSATPLGIAKFEHKVSALSDLLVGNTAGSLGETSGIVLITVGVILGARRIFDWRLPVSTVLTVAVCSGILHLFDASLPNPLFMVFSGGLLYGAVFMVTDPVTTPVTPKGAWIFGAGVGFLVVLIRIFGGLAEGVMFSILLMNAMTPLINRYTQPRRFGG
ncbi:MAG: RnfABCDGE type electron transport complex subunit D [Deltaproteobacteria bacterium]|nr:RnfABCDGE type electron transport complex subunit D [Deltaproteobacteria bacterium]